MFAFGGGWAAAQDTSQDWTRFRGPNGSGLREDCQVAVPWQSQQVLGRIALPAGGNGSPVIWGSKAFLLCGDLSTADRYVVCVD
ncbi:MAG: hypothetical protein ACK53L_02595, partial [Pirellulaceae bacterium]